MKAASAPLFMVSELSAVMALSTNPLAIKALGPSSLVTMNILKPLAAATPSSAWATSRRAIVVNSFSKYFAMTGWRLGWLLVPPELRRAVDCLTGNFTICPPVLAQIAAVAAFTPESVAEADARVEHYGVNRERLLNGLRAIGIDRLAPTDGAFYVYADVSDVTTNSMAFCSKLLAETGVAIAPGIDFDTVHGNSFVRLSFAGPTSDIDEALRRMEPWLRG